MEDTGSVVSLHKVNDNQVITITQNGTLIFWHVNSKWSPIKRVSVPNSDSLEIRISFSCLSCENFLALLIEPYSLVLFTLCRNTAIRPRHMPRPKDLQIRHYFTYPFEQRAICCDISQNEQYIAIGFETGQISVSLFCYARLLYIDFFFLQRLLVLTLSILRLLDY